jgi:hypothetical protein
MSIKSAKVSLPDSLIHEIAQKLSIKDKSRIPSELEFHAIGANESVKASTRGTPAPFGNVRVAVVA